MRKDINITQLREVTAFLGTLIDVLSKRYDANVKASTDADADYAAEVADARVDAWGNEKQCLGANIRDGQLKLDLQIQQAINTEEQLRLADNISLQEQLDDMSHAVLDAVEVMAQNKVSTTERLDLEETLRNDEDLDLQTQINSLSEAVLDILTQLARINGKLNS